MGNDNQNATQDTSDNAQPADPSAVVADLQRDVLDNFTEIEAITLSKLDTEKDVYYATILLKEKTSIKLSSATASRLITRFVDRYQALLLPVFLDSKEWHEYERDTLYRQLFDPRSSCDLAVRRFNRLKKSPDYPASIRRWYVGTVRRYIDSLDSVLAAESIPSEIALTAFLEMLRNTLSLLFASKGGVFSHDSDAVVFFREQFTSAESDFSESDLLLYFQLLALKQRILSSQVELTQNRRREFESLINPVANFLKRFERYIKTAFTSESEKRYRRRFALRVSLGVVFTIALMVLGYHAFFFFTIMDPVQLAGKKPGGIVGEYYKGRNFDTRVLSRVDKTIDIFSKGRLDPRLPKNDFSVRWNGYINISNDGKQYLCVKHDDGCRLYFYDKLIIDYWKRSNKKKSCAMINARKGWHAIKVEFFDNKGKAKLRLLYGLNKDDVKVVASRDLCCLK